MKTTNVYLENNLPERHSSFLFSILPSANCFSIRRRKKRSENFPGIIFHLFKQLVENIFKWRNFLFLSPQLGFAVVVGRLFYFLIFAKHRKFSYSTRGSILKGTVAHRSVCYLLITTSHLGLFSNFFIRCNFLNNV